MSRPTKVHAVVDRQGRRRVFEYEEARPGWGPFRPMAEVAGAPGGRSVDAAANVLCQMFSKLAEGGAVDLTEAAGASDLVIDAVADVGLAKWLDTVRAYHEGTFQHCLLVTGVATSFGVKNRMRRADIARLTMAGLMHDIGKARIPLAILDKPGRLDPEEQAIVQRHPVIGYDYLRAQNSAPIEVLSAVRHHHEYLDGSGYPDGISGADIGDITRIVTVCDIYGALIEERAYKPPKSPAEAIAILLTLAREGKVEESLVKAL
ncbi:HD-GYP domain-containing protein [Terrarubrum flagellatum]|uniref:HD-GYP domain-containing protein n=1 Tax=Terrirubrum flagellatum TaxID=2895980 RepID=UPI003145251D